MFMMSYLSYHYIYSVSQYPKILRICLMLSAENCQQKLSRQIAFDCLQAHCVKNI